MKIITIANEKGGVGKTTTATAMASILTQKGYKVLLIDADPQCNSTDTFRGNTKDVYTLADVILPDDENRCTIEDAIQQTQNGDLVPGDTALKRIDKKLTDATDIYRFADAMESLKNENFYDFAIIDTHPGLDMMLESCLLITDEVIIPLKAGRYSIAGLNTFVKQIAIIKKRMNPNIKIAGILMVMFVKREKLSRNAEIFLKQVADELGTTLFDTKIRRSVAQEDAQSERKCLIDYDAKCTTAIDYVAFVEEYLAKNS